MEVVLALLSNTAADQGFRVTYYNKDGFVGIIKKLWKVSLKPEKSRNYWNRLSFSFSYVIVSGQHKNPLRQY